MQGTSGSPIRRAGRWWTAALILGLALACYWPALQGQMVWDDDAHVTRPGLRSLEGLWRIWTDLHATQQYYPLLHSAFWVEHALWGDATLGYHLANVLQHAAAAFLLVVVLQRLKVPGALPAGLVFCVHPVCVESVAWISEQKNTLSLVFYLLAALAYLRFDGERGMPGARRHYLAASGLFALALLTKTVTASLPAALLVVLWWQRGRLAWRRDVRPLLPWFAAAAASGLFTSWVERTVIGAEGAGFDLSLVRRVLLAGRVVWFYLGKLAWPTDLVFVYPRWDVSSASAGWAAYPGAALLVTAALWAIRRRTRGPLAAWLLYVGSLFPALGFVNVYPFIFSYVADHFQYLASLAMITAASAGATRLLERAPPAARSGSLALVAALVTVLVILSNAQSQTYADQGTLYEATLQGNPRCWMANNNLGKWYEDRGDSDRAVAHYREALRLRGDYAQAHNNLGSWYENHGDLEHAASEFQEAIRLKIFYPAAHNNLGTVLGRSPDKLNEAVAQFKEALRQQPDFAQAHTNLGVALLKMPYRLNEAISQFEEAVRLQPYLASAHADLGNALSNIPERLDDAVAQYEEAIRIKPDYAEARNNLGLALSAQGRTDEALAEFEEALRLTPGFAEIHFNMALALLNAPGRKSEAAQQLQAFLLARPGNETAIQLLAQIRASPP
jgi:tetratricopeptide (TPR) repeat protein